ncbi:hypothetical protein Tco_0837801 [Tanacetum coccineum]
MAPLPAADQRHLWLRYQIKDYTEGIRHSYEQRLEIIWSRPVNRVHVLDFEGLTAKMRQDLAVRLRMVYSGEGQQVFVSHAWRRLFGIQGPLVREFILEFLSTCRMSDIVMDFDNADTLCFQLGGIYPRQGDLKDYSMKISSDRDFLGPAPSYVLIRDPHGPWTANVPHLLAHYLFRYAKGRKSGARLSGGHFIGRLAMHFGLVSNEGLRGLQAWVAQGPERQQAATSGAPEANEAGQAAKKVAPEIPAPAPAPAHAPLPPPPASQPHTMP